MAGAYTAKPAESSGPDVPPDWNIYWPFPGPLPPGYTMDLSLNLTSAAEYTPGETHDATVTLCDQTDYETSEPDGPSEITWSTTLEGAGIPLKFAGGEYSWNLESTYASVGTFWGAEPTFVFPV